MKKNIWIAAVGSLVFSLSAAGAGQWSAQDYDLYPGDFNGDGSQDLLYVALSPNEESGIALSNGSQPVAGY